MPYVSEKIWIGLANKLITRLKLNGFYNTETQEEAKKLIDFWTDEMVMLIYNSLNASPKIEWKDSIKRIIEIHNT